MPYFSMLMITGKGMSGKEAAQAWIDRRCIEEAAESIPGFLRGQVLVSDDSDDKACVMCVWSSKSGYEAWLQSPLREKQTADLTPVVSVDINTICFDQVHDVEKPS